MKFVGWSRGIYCCNMVDGSHCLAAKNKIGLLEMIIIQVWIVRKDNDDRSALSN